MPHRTVIFDFDGTIADTLEDCRQIYNNLASDFDGREIPADGLHELRDLSLMDLVRHLGIPKLKVPLLVARGTAMMRERITHLAPIPGIAETLPEFRKRYQMFGILTSNSSVNVDLFLRAHNLRGLFNFISSTSKLTGKAKHIRAIRKTFSLRPGDILYIGDEIRDVKAARKAGVDCAAVTWGFNSPKALAKAQPGFLLDSPEQLLTQIPS